MLARLRAHLRYANVVSTRCLFVLLGGSAYAATALKRGSVKGKHIAKNAITSSKVKNQTLRAGDFRAGVLPDAGTGIGNIVVHRTNVNLPAAAVPGGRGDDQFGFVQCAVDEKLIGGTAFTINSNGHVLSSRPGLDNTSGTLPEDGGTFSWWVARGETVTDAPTTMRVIAICAQTR